MVWFGPFAPVAGDRNCSSASLFVCLDDELDELKPEVLDFIFPSDAVYSQVGDNNASSSGKPCEILSRCCGILTFAC
ncbi:unnamed protein product [Linum trigynum]|uniref:Uncharacterized protein n=1 Tax=Linum trigynum TaxID=586398 RepID=A0AAV2FGW4_9ROSI